MKYAIACILFFSLATHAQESAGAQRKGLFSAADTVLYGGQLKPVTIFADDLDQYKFYVVKTRIKRMYEYVEEGKQIMAEIEKAESMKRKDYKRYKKSTEEELREKYEEKLKNLTMSEGQVLVKLINRETNNNCYDLIKDLKGGFVAFFYQQIGKRYGYDLKQNYDANKERDMEWAIKELQESGECLHLKPATLTRRSE